MHAVANVYVLLSAVLYLVGTICSSIAVCVHNCDSELNFPDMAIQNRLYAFRSTVENVYASVVISMFIYF